MSLSTVDLIIASISSIHAETGRPMLFLDPELEALHRAGRVGERPARVPAALRATWRRLSHQLNSAAARRAVL